MAAGISPIYTRTADIQWITAITTGNATLDLTSGTSYLVFTADATEGGFVREVRFKASPANATAATTVRIWLNNGSTLATALNSALIAEIGIPATTASSVNANPDFSIPINMALPAGYTLYCTIGTSAGGSGQYTATAIGGKY